MTSASALVWFKRDLRVRDHAALAEAMHFENALGLVLIEPQWLNSPECDPRHVGFLLECVAELQRELAARGLPLRLRIGALPEALHALRREFHCSHLFSHEETGPGWSWTRDRAVADWCRSQGVHWTELPQTGVVRRLRSRTGWAGRWAQRMNAPEASAVCGFKTTAGLDACALPTLRELGLPALNGPLPPAGERAAWVVLDGFLAAHLLAGQAGPRPGSAGPVHPPVGAGDRHLGLSTPDRRRAQGSGRRQGSTVRSAPNPRGPGRGRRDPATARLAKKRPAPDGDPGTQRPCEAAGSRPAILITPPCRGPHEPVQQASRFRAVGTGSSSAGPRRTDGHAPSTTHHGVAR